MRWTTTTHEPRESSADLDNPQPRLSINWLALPGTVVRGGVGRFAGKLPYAVYSDAVQFGPDGNQTVTFRGAQAPRFGQGPRGRPRPKRAAARGDPGAVRVRIEQPMVSQVTLECSAARRSRQRERGPRLESTRATCRARGTSCGGRRIAAGDSVGVPVPVGDASRPVMPVDGGFRRLTTTESGGRSTYAGMYTALRYDLTETLVLDANWVWSHAISNTEDINFNATQGNDFDAERADANNDRRHKVTARATWRTLRGLTMSGIVDYQTGMPLNRVAYFRDLTGSGGTYGDGFIGNYQRFFGVLAMGSGSRRRCWRTPAWRMTCASGARRSPCAARRSTCSTG
ncbi:MAG: hypothetical protein IPF47_13885 [Gemmatimonadetes bacterium]|nr:hypothetical protein [Gemmatimonadota bacterium]